VSLCDLHSSFHKERQPLVARLFTTINVGRGHDIYTYPLGVQFMSKAFLGMSSV
jgi:hypothetical protein